MTSVHDMKIAQETYEGLLRLFRFGGLAAGAIAALVIFLLSH